MRERKDLDTGPEFIVGEDHGGRIGFTLPLQLRSDFQANGHRGRAKEAHASVGGL